MSGERKQGSDHPHAAAPGEVDLEADAAACCQLFEHQLHCYGLLVIVCGVLLVVLYELMFPLLSGRR